MSIGPGDDLEFLKREFEEFIKGLICLPIKLPGTRLYKSLKVIKKIIIKKSLYLHLNLSFYIFFHCTASRIYIYENK